MYILAYLDFDRNNKIQVVPCRSEDEVVQYLMDLTEIPDLYEGMGVNLACAEIDYQIEDNNVYVGSIYLTITDSYGHVIYQL